jgi:hypothetical protein
MSQSKLHFLALVFLFSSAAISQQSPVPTSEQNSSPAEGRAKLEVIGPVDPATDAK